MKKTTQSSIRIAFIAVCIAAIPAYSQTTNCKHVSGTSTETIIPPSGAPNDPFGRVLGMFYGDFAGIANAAFTAILVTPPEFSGPSGPSKLITVKHVFLTGPGDTIATTGKAAFIPGPATQPGQTEVIQSHCPGTPCVIENPQVLDIIGGTGRFAGATGQLQNLGQGNLNLAQGQGVFIYVVKGQVCLPK